MPVPFPPARRRDGEATRARLVRAALELFTVTGYRGTTTPEIAERAGVAEATIYRHFSGKEALLVAAAVEAFRWGQALVTGEEKSPGGDVRAALGRIGRRLVDGALADPAHARMLLRPPDEALRSEDAAQALRQFRDALQQLVARGKQEGRVRPGSAELWAAVWLALAGYAAERVALREWPPDHVNVPQALEAAWDAIAYRSPSPPVSVVA